MKLVFAAFAIIPAVRGHPGRVRGHPGRDLTDDLAVSSGCPLFKENGAAPSYVAQSSAFSEVTCEENNKNCQVPTIQGLQTNVDMMTSACLQDIAPDGMTCKQVSESWTPACQDSTFATANLADGFKCGCMSDKVQKENFCERTCGLCSPLFVNSEVCSVFPLCACRSLFSSHNSVNTTYFPLSQGFRSGSYTDLEATTSLARGISGFTNPLARMKCEPYNVSAVAEAVRIMHTPDDPVLSAVTLDIPPTLRAAFHDACDYNKWSAIGGADGRFYNQPEAWYAQSRSVNAGLACPQKLMGFFSETSLSPGDAIQICAMVSTELAGGPKFEDFGFEPGRVMAAGVTQDGLIAGPLGDNKSLRDYFYRAGLDDIDIVALSGAHTLGMGTDSGFMGAFTLTPDIFSNDYFQNLIAYENVTDYGCNYFAPGSTPESRATMGCHPTNQNNAMAGIMQLPTDRALLLDEGFRQYVVLFANDKDVFFKQFAKSMKKMSELGRDVSVQWCDYTSTTEVNIPSIAYQTIA